MSGRRLDDLERRVALLEQQLPGVIRPAALREARMRAGWSQVELARRCRVTSQAVCRWESGVRLCAGASVDSVLRAFAQADVAPPTVG